VTPLRPGHHLYPAPDGWRCALPGDRFVRLGGPPEALRAFQSEAHGGPAVTEDLTALRGAFAERDLLADEPAPAVPPRITLTGTGLVAEALAALLGPWTELRRSDPGPVPREADLLVDCAGWLPDARWSALDTDCAATGLAWHRCHAEGTSFLLGPLTVPGRSPGYADLRGRRLAASGVADELLHHWAWLDTAAPPVPDPGPGAVAVVAGLLADEIAHWWHTGTAGPVGHQTEVTTAPLRVVRHPVLSLPDLAGQLR
jgi:hypothetical protein